MEVILKKTKITASILKQTLRSKEIDFKRGEILGWCIYNKLKYIVCYRSDINSLSIFPLFKDIEFGKSYSSSENYKNTEVGYLVHVKLSGNYMSISYTTESEKEKDDFITLLKKVKHLAETKGQFFL